MRLSSNNFRCPTVFIQTVSLYKTHTHFDVSVSLSVPLHTNPTRMCWPNTYYYNLPAPGKVGFQDYNNENLSIPLG